MGKAVTTNADNLGYFNPPNVYRPAIIDICLVGEYNPNDGAFNTYRITQNDGKIFEFEVKNGTGGSAGRSIVSVDEVETSYESRGENKIRVTFSDGTTSDFIVRNGGTGEPGPQGQRGPAGVDSVSATVDENVGTPSVDVSLVEGQMSLAFHNMKGEQGEPAVGVEEYKTYEAEEGMSWEDVLVLLPETGSADTLYRVACWDGTQYDDTTYSVYGWDGENYKFLEKKEPGIDDEPTNDSENLVKSGGVASVNGGYTTNPEYVRVITDSEGRFLVGIMSDGTIHFGAGCPPQVVEYINTYGYDKSAVETLLNTKVDKVEGKTLVDSEVASSTSIKEGSKWIAAQTDNEGKLLSGIDNNGETFVEDIYTSKDANPVKLSDLTEEYLISCAFFPAGQTSTIADNVLLRKNQIYKIKVEFIKAPESNVTVNIWPTKKSNGDWSRIVLSGSGINQTVYATIDTRSSENDELYKFTCRTTSGTSPEIRFTIYNPLFVPAVSSNTQPALPHYYYDYLQQRVFEIQKSIFSMGAGDVFGFLTDSHPSNRENKWCGKILKYIGDRTPIKKVFFGGDIGPSRPSAYGDGVSAKDSAVLSEIDQRERLDSAIAGCLALYKARGNHDYGISEGSTEVSENSWQATRKATRHFLVNDSDSAVIGDNSRLDSCYYYFDNKIQKIRYIVVDTSDWTDTKTGTSNVTMKISDAQIIWIIESAILTTPDDYKIVVMSHVPLADVAYIYNDDSRNEPTIKRLKNVLGAVNNRASIDVPMNYNASGIPSSSRHYDFSQMQANVVLCLGGHLHGDAETFEDGILFYTSHCDSCTASDYSYLEKQLFGIFSQKAVGTIYENLVNIVSVDTTSDIVKVFRFGVGVDKIFNLEKKTVPAGQSIQLETSLSNPVWNAYDATGINDNYSTNPDTGDAFMHTHSTIDSGTGLLVGLTSGGVVAVAYSKEENKMEFFNVIVS